VGCTVGSRTGAPPRGLLSYTPPMDEMSKERLARELGYGGPMPALEVALQEAGLSRPEKRNVSSAKRRAIADLIAERFVLVCHRGDCRTEVRAEERVVVSAASPEFCEVCGGSPVSTALREMSAACRHAGVRRIVVVGGSPVIRARLEREVGDELELRLVDGTTARSVGQAKEDLAWADLLIVWSGSELAHKATMAYPKGHPRMITLTRRGIPALARAVVGFTKGPGGAPGAV
jgi:hypothetical protein